MVRIRLSRFGAKKQPCYRIVVADQRTPRGGTFIDEIGTYKPLKEGDLKIDAEKASDWLKKGAQPTEKVKALLKKAGVTE